ncbi:MAG: zinc ribbon domain-containing protein [Ruminiclostridium sp.]
MALKHHAFIIQMEDLTGAEFTDNMFYFDLQRAVQTLCEEKCIIIRYVNKYMTSQRCSWCGFIDKGNRTSQSNFTCLNCGYSVNADYNVSKNIATANIEAIIKATINNYCKVDNMG